MPPSNGAGQTPISSKPTIRSVRYKQGSWRSNHNCLHIVSSYRWRHHPLPALGVSSRSISAGPRGGLASSPSHLSCRQSPRRPCRPPSVRSLGLPAAAWLFRKLKAGRPRHTAAPSPHPEPEHEERCVSPASGQPLHATFAAGPSCLVLVDADLGVAHVTRRGARGRPQWLCVLLSDPSRQRACPPSSGMALPDSPLPVGGQGAGRGEHSDYVLRMSLRQRPCPSLVSK